MLKQWRQPRGPENEGENQDISMETAFTLSLAGHIAVPSPRARGLLWV